MSSFTSNFLWGKEETDSFDNTHEYYLELSEKWKAIAWEPQSLKFPNFESPGKETRYTWPREQKTMQLECFEDMHLTEKEEEEELQQFWDLNVVRKCCSRGHHIPRRRELRQSISHATVCGAHALCYLYWSEQQAWTRQKTTYQRHQLHLVWTREPTEWRKRNIGNELFDHLVDVRFLSICLPYPVVNIQFLPEHEVTGITTFYGLVCYFYFTPPKWEYNDRADLYMYKPSRRKYRVKAILPHREFLRCMDLLLQIKESHLNSLLQSTPLDCENEVQHLLIRLRQNLYQVGARGILMEGLKKMMYDCFREESKQKRRSFPEHSATVTSFERAWEKRGCSHFASKRRVKIWGL
jgi:hypothetical protein